MEQEMTGPTREEAAPTIEAAHEIGANGGPVVEAERLAFEAWMHGHCWSLGCEWNGKGYRSKLEVDGYVSAVATHTRGMWAAWRDRAALAFAAGSRSGEDARDAARYRWLRDKAAYVGVTARKECLWTLRGVYELPGKGFDAAIDAAMGGNDA